MKRKKLLILSFACILVALCLVLYPLIGNLMSEKHHSDLETSYTEALDEVTDQEIQDAYDAAVAYNSMLAEGISSAPPVAYRNHLNVTEDGIMGYVHIPKLGIELPICHGTDAETLEHAVGHVVGTSLPVGGESTHAVLSAHSGMAVSKLFSDLDKLAEGDVFYITVLGQTLAYQVDQISVVEPTDTSKLQIENGKDYVTLVTCTPFGVNSHRLLVRGERAEVPEITAISAENEQPMDSPSTWTQHYLKGLGIGAALLAVCLGVYFIYRRKKCEK